MLRVAEQEYLAMAPSAHLSVLKEGSLLCCFELSPIFFPPRFCLWMFPYLTAGSKDRERSNTMCWTELKPSETN